MIWAALTLAFFCFLSWGELKCNSKFKSDTHLTVENVAFIPSPNAGNGDSISVLIKESKTDSFRIGQTNRY